MSEPDFTPPAEALPVPGWPKRSWIEAKSSFRTRQPDVVRVAGIAPLVTRDQTREYESPSWRDTSTKSK